MILISYDGSEDARSAIEQAARLFPGQSATVLTVWEPFIQVATRSSVGFGLVPSIPEAQEIDAASADAAEQTAAEGAELAGKFGLTAQGRITAQDTTTARAILAEARERSADAIVMGSRGRSGLKSLLLGSVSHETIQRADRTVVVVPSADVAASRERDAREDPLA